MTKVIVFSGGRGSSSLIKALKVFPNVELRLIVNAYDNGLSTGILRSIFEILGISDIRKNIGLLSLGDEVNLERCMRLNARLDGHIVQGHVDKTATCVAIEDQDGSTMFTFEYEGEEVTVEKGSVTVNGISLTVVNSQDNKFSVCIIPYTIEHTNLKNVTTDTVVNLEFDIIGKYVAKLFNK